MEIFNNKKSLIQKHFLIIMMVLILTSCKKLVESEPPSTAITDNAVFKTDATAIAALTGIYTLLNSSPFQGNTGLSVLMGLSADELSLYSGSTSTLYLNYYYNALSQRLPALLTGAENWGPCYFLIFNCNAALQWLESSNDLTPAVKKQLIGEAKFFRAFCYFYLVNLYGDLPLALSTDPEVNSQLARSPKTEVYQQIISDLIAAEANLSADFLNETLLSSSPERIRLTRWAAEALLARVYLYMGEWEKAEAKANLLIENKNLFDLLPLNSVFLKNSKEAIWQIQPTAINFNTLDAQTLVIPQTGPNAGANPVFLSDTLLNSFEPGDLRAKYGNWVDTTIYKLTPTLNDTVAYANKYKLYLSDATITSATGTANMKEYFMVLRLGEQYLIRAEAKAQLGNIQGAKDDLNAIRNRAFSPAKLTDANDKATVLAAILHERQVELFLEGGHRWLDLKRTGKIDEVMKGITPLKANGAGWQSYQQWYPLPLTLDLRRDPNLVQNEGY
jgi:hypothetical protein